MAKFKDGEMPPQLWLLGASEFSADSVDDFTKSQMWDCMDERDEILGRCRWQMHAVGHARIAARARTREPRHGFHGRAR